MGRVALIIDDQEIQTWQGATILESGIRKQNLYPAPLLPSRLKTCGKLPYLSCRT